MSGADKALFLTLDTLGEGNVTRFCGFKMGGDLGFLSSVCAGASLIVGMLGAGNSLSEQLPFFTLIVSVSLSLEEELSFLPFTPFMAEGNSGPYTLSLVIPLDFAFTNVCSLITCVELPQPLPGSVFNLFVVNVEGF